MTIDFEADLDEIFSSDDHAVEVIFEGRTFNGIFNREFFVHEVGDVGMDGADPALYCRTSDAHDIQQGHTLTIDGREYTAATDPEPDGVGMSRIALNG